MTLRSVAAALAVLALSGAAGAAPPSPTTDLGRVEAVQARFGAAAQVQLDSTRTRVRGLRGLAVATTGADPGERAARFVRSAKDVLGLAGDVVPVETRSMRGHIVRLQATFAGAPVEGRAVVVVMDDAARVTSVTSDLGPLVVPTPAHELTPAAAEAAVRERYVVAATAAPTRVVVANGSAGRFAWKVPTMVMPMVGHFWVWIDAETGETLRTAPAGSDQRMTELTLRSGEVAE